MHKFIILVFVLFGTVLNVSSAEKKNEITIDNKIVYCSEGSPTTFAPGLETSGTDYDAMRPIYSTLLRTIRGSTRITAGLAEHWVASRDGMEYIFDLRKGVKWHSNEHFKPTREFNADDVIFSFERQWLVDHPFHKIGGGEYFFFQSAGMPNLLESITKIDDYKIKIRLTKPNTTFLHMLITGFTSIQSSEYAQKMMEQGRPETIDKHPIGTGPFEFVNYNKDRSINYKRFEDYWEGRAKIEKIKFKIVKDPGERWKKLQNDQCQVMAQPLADQIEEMRGNPSVTVSQIPGINVSYLAYNLTKEPFKDIRVRKALNMSINKKNILEKVYRGNAMNAITLIPPTMWSHNYNVLDDVYNPEAAKKLLKEAGYLNGFETELWVMSVTRIHNPNPQLMAELIARDLSKIGVNARIKVVDWNEYNRRLNNGEHQMAIQGWTGSYGDPDYFFYNLLTCEAAKNGGFNVSKFCSDRYDELVNRARKIANPALRIPLYEEAQQLFKDQAPWLTIAHTMQTAVYKNRVQNLRLDPFGGFTFYGVEVVSAD